MLYDESARAAATQEEIDQMTAELSDARAELKPVEQPGDGYGSGDADNVQDSGTDRGNQDGADGTGVDKAAKTGDHAPFAAAGTILALSVGAALTVLRKKKCR